MTSYAMVGILKLNNLLTIIFDAVFQISYCNIEVMYIICKYGEGKYLILYGIVTVLRGITVCVVPLIGLGSDQVFKSRRKSVGHESYHADEFRPIDCAKLVQLLETHSPDNVSSIIIYISPQNLHSTSKWYKLLNKQATQGALSSFL